MFLKFFLIRKFVEKISKDESFDVSQSLENVNDPENVQENNNSHSNIQNESKNSKTRKRIKYEKNQLNFIYPQFIVLS